MNAPQKECFRATADQADRRLDRVLRGLFRDVPLCAIMKAVRCGAIRLNGGRTSGDARLAEGDEVAVPWASEIPAARAKQIHSHNREEKLATILKNGDVWCVEKPAGLLSQPDKEGGDSLITRAWAQLGWDRRDFRPALIGRLDRNVSGVEAIAMNAPALRALSEAMRQGRIKKIYIAVVCGDAPEEGEISVPLIKDAGGNFARAARAGERGLDALTRFRKLSGNGRYSMMEVELVTGRPHQARAHLASIGHPVAGDLKYGSRNAAGSQRLMLHAHMMSFPVTMELPVGVRGVEAVSPVPAGFGKLLTKMSHGFIK
ncbi:MAG: RluA family pseudouridine synthase [Synergistaceae bacterium]|jgi:23S rRNA pseudouridine955/2504/2580 synthase|nr:RluA family pseudouridine synthase [Synergistaceae bacterium]